MPCCNGSYHFSVTLDQVHKFEKEVGQIAALYLPAVGGVSEIYVNEQLVKATTAIELAPVQSFP